MWSTDNFPIPEEAFNRFLSNVETGPPADCWIWKRCPDRQTYGNFSFNKEKYPAHRLSILLDGRSFTEEKPFALHSCHTPACVNPNHLRPGSAADNISDCLRANRFCIADKRTDKKLTSSSVRWVMDQLKTGARHAELAAALGVSGTVISNISLGKTWASVSGANKGAPHKRRTSRQDAVAIMKRVLAGESQSEVARSLRVHQTTVHYILKSAGYFESQTQDTHAKTEW